MGFGVAVSPSVPVLSYSLLYSAGSSKDGETTTGKIINETKSNGLEKLYFKTS